MKKLIQFAFFSAVLIQALGSITSFAAEKPQIVDGHHSVIHGGNLEMSKAASRDTVHLIGPWGSGAVVNGQFEDTGGVPNWNGWTSIDLTQKTESAWHVDTYNVVSGVYSAWCGDISYNACNELDPIGGYGPKYNEFLSWYGTVDNPGVPTTVNISATVNHDTEPGYDYSNLGYWKNDYDIAYLWTADGDGEQVAVASQVVYQPGEYVGEGENQVRISWHVTSDGGWDDSDCSYYGDGALQVDDISVTMTNDGVVTSTFDDFETSGPLGTLGDNWVVEFPPGVGDYAHILAGLEDEDPCESNYSPVACFIADDVMLAERGLPVAYCTDWCYGPGGYIVTTDGGRLGPASRIHNAIESPIIEWPAGDYLGVRYVFDVFKHEDLSSNSPGIFYTWGIRSTASSEPADIEQESFQDRNFVYYGGPDWIRGGEPEAADLVVPGCTYVQVQLAVYELGYISWDGWDGYPAPYFDNVSLKCYNYYGPALSARELDLAQDAFPADGQIHRGADMHLNDVRFDMANNISLDTDLRNDPGDSIVCTITPMRTGSVLVEADVDVTVKAPRLHWTLKIGQSVEAAWRTNLALAGSDGSLDANGNLYGEVQGARAVANGVPSPDRWMFLLPDEEFLYPGDVLHYYIEAWDDVAGSFQNATLPADLTGYGDFSSPLAYNTSFVVHALPTLLNYAGDQPDILFWNDFANRGGQDEWYGAFTGLGLLPGEDYDIYYTNAPTSGVGNGLGGRAAYGQLDGYKILLYTSGDLSFDTITNLNFDYDAGDDVGLLDNWLSQGDKHLFATGDELITDMMGWGGVASQAFVSDWMGVTRDDDDVRPYLAGDTAPMVYPITDNPAFHTTDSWIAYGGCPELNTFDAVTVSSGEQLAVFNDGTSVYSAATLFTAANGSMVVSMPYDFMNIRTPSTKASPAPLPVRAELLGEILELFDTWPAGVGLPNKVFATSAYPNPFNPITKIEFNLPKTEHLSLKIFNVRGELVRTLINEVTAEGPGFIIWNGSNDQGREASSGVYFYEARTADGVEINKMTLVQ
ncbi:MAG: T9SS type A sorting domain-containing protein [Gemmatimonadales bacterium]|nr:T9SS type A sorting domain-containing protein [Gemmatimonadales bacterium]